MKTQNNTKIKIPTIEELMAWNKDIGRRLYLSDKHPGKLVCSDGTIAKIEKIWPSEVISVPDVGQSPDYLMKLGYEPSDANFRDCEFRPSSHEWKYLTTVEAKIVLGRDYIESFSAEFSRDSIAEFNAMLECAKLPSEHSNAYFLGRGNTGMCLSGGSLKNDVPFPVQYFKIDNCQYNGLAVNRKDIGNLIKQLEEERGKEKWKK